jgi:DNA-binding transcriptional regulator YiaG
MTLKDYIETQADFSIEELAARWGCTVRAIHAWKRGERIPTPAQAKIIIRTTGGGVLDYVAIYGDPYDETG